MKDVTVRRTEKAEENIEDKDPNDNNEIPRNYQYLKYYVNKLLVDNPSDKNVFLITSHQNTPKLQQIIKTLVETLRNLGLKPLLKEIDTTIGETFEKMKKFNLL